MSTKRKRCADCPHRYAVGRSKRCKVCQKRHARRMNYSRYLVKTYGITIEEYDRMLADQTGRCAICKGGTSKHHFQVDHNHDTGEVRGLLCARCNRQLLTAARNQPWILRAAADYLENYPSRRVLSKRDWSNFAD